MGSRRKISQKNHDIIPLMTLQTAKIIIILLVAAVAVLVGLLIMPRGAVSIF